MGLFLPACPPDGPLRGLQARASHAPDNRQSPAWPSLGVSLSGPLWDTFAEFPAEVSRWPIGGGHEPARWVRIAVPSSATIGDGGGSRERLVGARLGQRSFV